MGLILESWDGRMCRSPREERQQGVASGLHPGARGSHRPCDRAHRAWRDVDSAGNGAMWRLWGGVDWWVMPMFVQGLF